MTKNLVEEVLGCCKSSRETWQGDQFTGFGESVDYNENAGVASCRNINAKM